MKNVIRYTVLTVIGLLIALFILLSKNVFKLTNPIDIYHQLTNAFFIPGVLITGYGLLVIASNGGTFDMLTFGIIKVIDLFRRDLSKAKHKTFYDYRVAKQDRKQRFGYLIIVGLAFLAVSFLFLWLYYKVK